ncbi:LON peptidase substrate-binding domain-containing protein [Iodidimonas sp. SYSU 1G8]|uniref:LON peptidase substrate-binding domain-containing protein n=1 Tax=Iodidimonas sp. SYSU 1G8 TaxID=3133967 RepID=UPI0031FF06CA
MIQDWTQLPDILPVFPLTGALLLPRGALPLNIFEARYRTMIEDALKGRRVIGMVQPRTLESESQEPPVYDIGCAGRLTAFQELEDGRYIITLTGIRRFRIVEELARTTPYRLFKVDYAGFMRDFEPETAHSANRDYFLKLIRQYVDLQGYQVDWDMIENTDTETLIHASSTLAPWAPNEKQALLEAADIERRYQTLIALYEMAIAQAAGTGGSLQ